MPASIFVMMLPSIKRSALTDLMWSSLPWTRIVPPWRRIEFDAMLKVIGLRAVPFLSTADLQYIRKTQYVSRN